MDVHDGEIDRFSYPQLTSMLLGDANSSHRADCLHDDGSKPTGSADQISFVSTSIDRSIGGISSLPFRLGTLLEAAGLLLSLAFHFGVMQVFKVGDRDDNCKNQTTFFNDTTMSMTTSVVTESTETGVPSNVVRNCSNNLIFQFDEVFSLPLT